MKHRVLAIVLTICIVLTLVGPTLVDTFGLHAHAAEDGTISIEKDFTTREAYDMTWQQDPEVVDYGGNLTITPDSIRALGCGKQNSSSTGAGYVTYKVEAPEGNVIKTLRYDATGRAYHSTSNSECNAGTCACDYAVSISTDGGVTFTQVSTEEIVTSGNENAAFSYDLTSYAAGKSSVQVKLYMSGKSWNWVCMKKLAITGTYGEGSAEAPAEPKEGEFAYADGNFKMTRVFTDMTAYDRSFLNDPAVYEYTGDLLISPSTASLGAGRQNESSTGAGSISYLMEAPEGSVLTGGVFKFYGRTFHSSSNSACSAGTCACAFTVSVSTDGGATYQVVKDEPIVTSGSTKDFEYDLTSFISGKESAILKIYLSGKSWDWVRIDNLEISGTYGAPVRNEGQFYYENGAFEMTRVFTDMTAYDRSFLNDPAVFDYSGDLLISPSTASLGAGRQNETSTGAGSISYLMEAPEGSVLNGGVFKFYGRTFHSSSNSECSAGTCACAFTVSVSTDGGATYQVVKDEPIVTSGSTKDFEYDLTSLISGKESAILKIYLSGKSWDWVRIDNLEVSGTYAEKPAEESAPWTEIDAPYDEIVGSDFAVKYDYSKLPAYDTSWQDAAHDFNFMTISPENSVLGVGQKDVSAEGTGYVTYKFEAPEGKLLSEAHILLKGRAFHYPEDPVCSKGECDCRFEVQVSTDGQNYKTVTTEYPGISGAWNVGFSYDLHEAVRGAKVAYIRVQVTTKNWDWISFSSMSIWGKYRSESVGISGSVTMTPQQGAGQFTAGSDFTLTAKLDNGSGEAFEGRIELVYPGYYLSCENRSQAVSVVNGGSGTYTFNATALEGGYGNMYLCVFDKDGNLLDSLEILMYVGGKGYYLGDGHNHSYESDGRNSFVQNFAQLAEKGFSFIITADHDAKNPGDDTAQQAAIEELKKTFTGEFIAIKGSEVTTSGNAHVLCYNFATNYESLTNTQTVIDGVINEGGLAYLAHPFIKGYLFNGLGEDPTQVDALKGFTGVEIFNGETNWVRGWENGGTEKNLEFWDRLNLTGYRKFYGTADSDGHDSIILGHGGNALLLDELTEENVMHAMATGSFYMTTGPALRFQLGGATFGESLFVRGSKETTLSIYAYDPDYAITEVVLYKLAVGQSYEEAMANAVTLYKRGEDTIHSFTYNQKITVSEGEIYRVAVYTERGSKTWSDDSPGFAFGNPVWVEKEMTGITLTAPTKLVYEEGDVADLSGMKVVANYHDGTSKEVIGWYASGFDSSKLGKQDITVEYNGFTQSFQIEVMEVKGEMVVENGTILFDRTFSDMPAYSQDWKNDPAVYEAGGNLTISPDGAYGLGVGTKGESSTGAGYVSYLVEVPEGNVVKTLKATITGRMYHSTSNAACKAGECACDFQIYVSRNGGLSYVQVTDYDIDKGSSALGQTLEFDLTDAITDCGTVIVKFYMSGKSWNWTCMQALKIEGTYAEGQAIPMPAPGSVLIENGTIIYDKDFTTLPQYDMSWAEDAAVYEYLGNLTVSPSHRSLGVGKKNSSSTGAGSVSYLVDVPEGNVITGLTFTAHGRAYHSTSGADCSAGKCTCDFKVYISTDGGKLYTEVYDHDVTFEGSGWDHDFTFDLTEYIKDKKTAIIKVYMSGRSWDWVGFENFSIRGTYAEGTYIPDVVEEYVIEEDFYTIGVGNDDKWKPKVDSYDNVIIGSGEKPWLSVEPQEGTWDGVTGQLIYKVQTSGGNFDALTVTGTARVFSFEGSTAVFNIYVSTNGTDWQLVKALPSTTNGGELNNFNEDLLKYVSNSNVAYVKIEMQSGFWDWVCLRNIRIAGAVKVEYINVTVMDGETPVEQDSQFVSGGIWTKLPEKTGYTAQLFTDAALTVPYAGTALTENTTLYVQWTPVTYNVTYSGTELPAGTYTIETGLTLPVPEKDGYTFDGWFASEDLSGDAVTKIAAGTTGDITLYAKWTIIPTEEPDPIPPTGDVMLGTLLALMVVSAAASLAVLRKKRI